MTRFSPVARPPLLHIHTSIIIIIYKEERKTGTHTKGVNHNMPTYTRDVWRGPKNDEGVPPSPPSKELWLDGSSVVSSRVVVASTRVLRRGMTRGAKEVVGTMRGCPSLPPTAGGGAFGSILRLTFSFFSVFSFFLSLFLFFKFNVILRWRGGVQ